MEYSISRLNDVLAFERELREQEPDWGWVIDQEYISDATKSFADDRFGASVSLLAYEGGQVVGRIDAALIPSRFDGSVKAYLDWICVLKSHRHKGVARALMDALKARLKAAQVSVIVGIAAQNEEALSFYRAVEGIRIRDQGFWIDL